MRSDSGVDARVLCSDNCPPDETVTSNRTPMIELTMDTNGVGAQPLRGLGRGGIGVHPDAPDTVTPSPTVRPARTRGGMSWLVPSRPATAFLTKSG
jgi:hypothetical protein